MEDYTPAEYAQLRLIYAAVYHTLEYIDEDVLELQKSIQAGVRLNPFQVAVAGHGGSGSVKYSDRYPPLSKCITAFKTNINGLHLDDIRKYWRWIGRDSHDRLLRRYIRQFSSTIKICNSIGYAIKCQSAYYGADVLAKGDRYYFERDPKFTEQLEKATLMLVGIDKEKHPVVLMKARQHNPKSENKELVRRIDFLMCETVAAITHNLEGSTIIHDLSNLTTKNRDVTLVKFALTSLARLYPRCVSRYIFYNAPTFYKLGFKMINATLDPSLKSKILFLSNVSELLEYIDLDQLPRELSGTSSISTIGYVPPRAEDDALMNDTKTRDKLLAERSRLLDKFQDGIAKWVRGEKYPDRFEVLADIVANHRSLDPYIRSKTIWDRQGIIKLISPEYAAETPNSPEIPFDLVNTGVDLVTSLTPPSCSENDELETEATELRMPPPLEEQQHKISQDQGGVMFDQEVVFEHLQMLESQHYNTPYVDENPYPIYLEPEESDPVHEGQDHRSDYTYEYQSQQQPTTTVPTAMPPPNSSAMSGQEGYGYAALPVERYNEVSYTHIPEQYNVQHHQYNGLTTPDGYAVPGMAMSAGQMPSKQIQSRQFPSGRLPNEKMPMVLPGFSHASAQLPIHGLSASQAGSQAGVRAYSHGVSSYASSITPGPHSRSHSYSHSRNHSASHAYIADQAVATPASTNPGSFSTASDNFNDLNGSGSDQLQEPDQNYDIHHPSFHPPPHYG